LAAGAISARSVAAPVPVPPRARELGNDVTETLEARRKRLLLRSRYRGFLENDLLLGRFAEAHLASLDEPGLDAYEKLLEEADVDIFAWATRRRPVPARHDNTVMALLQRQSAVGTLAR
jgi:antitoxin CptB